MVLGEAMITIIYYTSNREHPDFEDQIRGNIERVANGIPIISVSQKPIDFGKNICVGDVGLSDHNIYRQLLIGCEAATTKLIATAEADCLYPPGAFNLDPPKIDWCWRNSNLWVYYKGKDQFREKRWSLCSQVSGRLYLMDAIKKRLEGWPEWIPEPSYEGMDIKYKDIFHGNRNWSSMRTHFPVVNIKTGDGMRSVTNGTGQKKSDLPHWGKADDVRRRFWTLQ